MSSLFQKISITFSAVCLVLIRHSSRMRIFCVSKWTSMDHSCTIGLLCASHVYLHPRKNRLMIKATSDIRRMNSCWKLTMHRHISNLVMLQVLTTCWVSTINTYAIFHWCVLLFLFALFTWGSKYWFFPPKISLLFLSVLPFIPVWPCLVARHLISTKLSSQAVCSRLMLENMED